MHLNERAPAKVNLSLLVGPRDEHGYHELFTVFAPVDVYDELEFELEARLSAGRSCELRVACPAISGEANLTAQALRALERHTGWAFDGLVEVAKGIPVGAGLGGGSADAAMALRAGARVLEEAGGPVLSDTVLRMLARTLGADVAFFLDSRPAIGRGIGELLEPLSLPSLDLVLVFLEHHLSTAKVYRAFDALRQPEGKVDFAARAAAAEARWLALADAMTEGTLAAGEIVAALAGLLENDLEEASFGLFPPLIAAKQALFDEGASGCLMSGSGPTLYGVCESRATAAELCRRVQRRGLNARVARAGRLGDNPVLS